MEEVGGGGGEAGAGGDALLGRVVVDADGHQVVEQRGVALEVGLTAALQDGGRVLEHRVGALLCDARGRLPGDQRLLHLGDDLLLCSLVRRFRLQDGALRRLAFSAVEPRELQRQRDAHGQAVELRRGRYLVAHFGVVGVARAQFDLRGAGRVDQRKVALGQRPRQFRGAQVRAVLQGQFHHFLRGAVGKAYGHFRIGDILDRQAAGIKREGVQGVGVLRLRGEVVRAQGPGLDARLPGVHPAAVAQLGPQAVGLRHPLHPLVGGALDRQQRPGLLRPHPGEGRLGLQVAEPVVQRGPREVLLTLGHAYAGAADIAQAERVGQPGLHRLAHLQRPVLVVAVGKRYLRVVEHVRRTGLGLGDIHLISLGQIGGIVLLHRPDIV